MNSRRGAGPLGVQTPRIRHVPPAALNDAEDAAFLSSKYGLEPDEWQLDVLGGWMGVRRDGNWAASRCGLAVPRQNGKNAVLEIRELFGMIVLGEKFLHTAHEVKTARKAFLRLKSFFENRRKYPELAALVADIRQTNGQEAIVLRNGGSVEFVARSKGSGRGFTVDILVMDEAQELSEDALEALLPTISAAPSGHPQQIMTGTPPGPVANGEIFTRMRVAGKNGSDPRLSWHEWSADPEHEVGSLAALAQSNPALGIRLQRDVTDAERESLTDAGYAREREGRWASDAELAVIPGWDEMAGDGPAQDVAPTALSVDMSHDRVIAIAAGWGLPDEAAHVELIALDRTEDTLSAMEWIIARAGRRIPVVFDMYSPAALMIPTLKARKVKVITVNAGADMAKACGGFHAAAVEGRLTHGGQQQADDALAGAKTRPIRDAGGWGWDRKDPTTNIAPLVALTLAHYGVALSKRARTQPQRITVLS